MLNNWFNKSDDNQAGHLKQSFDGPLASTVELSRPLADLTDEKPQRVVTTALSTPHDAVLAELHGRKLEVDIPGKEQLVIEDADQRQLNNPYPARPDFLTDFPTTSDHLFDPFTGAYIGDLQSGEAEQDPDVKTEDELWTHLSKILKLQSDIADRHVKMEGIGLRKPGPTLDKSKEGGGINRRPSTSGGREWGEGAADEGVDEEADEEAETKRKREEEFSRLTSKFTGRKDAIDGIMKDLDELSSALKTFHALRTPIIDLQSNLNPASASTSTTPSAFRTAMQPSPAPLSPNTPHSASAAASSPGTQKRHSLSKLLPLLDEAHPAVVDSPDSIGAELPDVRGR